VAALLLTHGHFDHVGFARRMREEVGVPAWAPAGERPVVARPWHTEICPDERAPTVTAFVERALAFFADHGIKPKRLQTDNAFAYVHNRSLRELLAHHHIHHRTIPPRTPKRNGRIERYQQTLGREWAHGQRYRNSTARAKALPIWLNHYNTTRNHSSLGNRPPITRVRNQPRHNS
jgi:transposase InsO family protein